MSLIASRGGGSVPPLEPGTYQAVCCGVIDLGRQYSEKFDKTAPKVLIMWDIVGETVEIDGVPAPRRLFKQYTNSLDERSTLAKDINSWRGQPFSPDELKAFDLRRLLNVGCQLSVVHEQRPDGRAFVNIAAVIGLPKGMQIPPMSEAICYDADDHDAAVFARLPEWVQDRIKQSEQWKASGAGGAIQREALPFDEPPEIDTIGGSFGNGELPF